MCLVTELRWNNESHVACRKNVRLLIEKKMPEKKKHGPRAFGLFLSLDA